MLVKKNMVYKTESQFNYSFYSLRCVCKMFGGFFRSYLNAKSAIGLCHVAKGERHFFPFFFLVKKFPRDNVWFLEKFALLKLKSIEIA